LVKLYYLCKRNKFFNIWG